jgi:hypothetical protein
LLNSLPLYIFIYIVKYLIICVYYLYFYCFSLLLRAKRAATLSLTTEFMCCMWPRGSWDLYKPLLNSIFGYRGLVEFGWLFEYAIRMITRGRPQIMRCSYIDVVLVVNSSQFKIGKCALLCQTQLCLLLQAFIKVTYNLVTIRGEDNMLFSAVLFPVKQWSIATETINQTDRRRQDDVLECSWKPKHPRYRDTVAELYLLFTRSTFYFNNKRPITIVAIFVSKWLTSTYINLQ